MQNDWCIEVYKNRLREIFRDQKNENLTNKIRMKTNQKLLLGILAAGTLSLTIPTQAALSFDQNVTGNVIMGSGIGNGAWTVNQNSTAGVELGLRAKTRYPSPLAPVGNPTGNTYDFPAGNPGGSIAGRALWNFEWSINSSFNNSGGNLNSLTYLLLIDGDPGAGQSWLSFDPVNQPFSDNSIGNNTTAQGAGVQATTALQYGGLIGANNLAQNSWNMGFGFISGNLPLGFTPFNPNVNGTYDFELIAYLSGSEVAKTMMTVNVVPEPSTYVAGALMLLPFGMSAVRKFRKSRAA